MKKLNSIRIIKGEDRTAPLQFVNEDGQCFDMGTPTDVQVTFEQEDGNKLIKTLGSGVTVISASRGEITVDLTAAETLLLRACQKGDILGEWTSSAKVRKAKFRGILYVED
mgnify:CR=1 FL=1